ncbi:MAG TPA: MGMT family protein [Gemmatimonadales bacterium]|nr:MGMT family protein [Gemmatimonadales bacterium]
MTSGGAASAEGRVNPFYHRIYKVVRHIPKGRVATYGLVARLAGRPGAARTVGWALSALRDDSDVPWWRVLNAAGRISLSGADHGSVVQRALLLREGVKFAPGGAVNLAVFGWPAEAYDSAAAAHTRAASSRRSRRLKGLRT